MVGLDRRLNPPGADCRAHAAKAIFPPIRPLVAEILNIYLLIGQGGKAAAVFVPLFLLACALFEKKKKGENPRGGHGSEKGVIILFFAI
jgi:hypothetical protein